VLAAATVFILVFIVNAAWIERVIEFLARGRALAKSAQT
jgi:hypothetical protein